MSVYKLIKHFAAVEHVPVEIQHVVDRLRDLGVNDEIYYFWDADLSINILSGFIVRDEYAANPLVRFRTTITYGHMGDEKERLVCCKELIHILDTDAARVSSKEQLETQIEKMALPPELVDPFNEGGAVKSDRVALIEAVAILFPFAARQLLMPLYKANKIGLKQIGDMIEIPIEYAALVMSDYWQSIHEALLAVRQLNDGKEEDVTG